MFILKTIIAAAAAAVVAAVPKNSCQKTLFL